MDSEERRKPGRKPSSEITEHQLKTLRVIRSLMSERGFPPTVAEIAETLGIATTSVYEQVNQLVRKGYIERQPGKARGLSVTEETVSMPTTLITVPIIGSVAAGQPILADENIVGEIAVDSSVIRGGRHFALAVKGDSMIDAGILDGDLVVVRQQPVGENGDVVVALLGDEATVKRLSIRDESIELRPENPRHRPIVIEPDDELRIVGKVVAIRHPAGS